VALCVVVYVDMCMCVYVSLCIRLSMYMCTCMSVPLFLCGSVSLCMFVCVYLSLCVSVSQCLIVAVTLCPAGESECTTNERAHNKRQIATRQMSEYTTNERHAATLHDLDKPILHVLWYTLSGICYTTNERAHNKQHVATRQMIEYTTNERAHDTPVRERIRRSHAVVLSMSQSSDAGGERVQNLLEPGPADENHLHGVNLLSNNSCIMYQSGRLPLCTPIATHDVHNRGPLHMLIKAARCTMLFQAVARYTLHNCGLLHELLKVTREPMLLQAVARCTLHSGDPLHTMSEE
jgi:hypothetical protein